MLNGMIVEENGDKHWYQNDQLHRTDGPAIEYANGTKMWCQNDQLHRIDGPAVEYADGGKRWWFEDHEYDLNDWLNLVDFTEVQKTLMRLQYA
jgi:hypothetical protein